MANPFSRAIDACLEHLGVAAVYTPDGGGALDIRVIARRPDQVFDFGDTRIHAETAMFDVRVSDVVSPRPGDRLEVDGSEYVVQSEPVRDRERLVWTLDVRPM